MISRKMLWVSYVMSTLTVLMLLFSGMMKMVKPPSVVEGFALVGEPFHMAVLLGALLWGGLYLKDERLRLLIPLRSE